MRTAAIAGAAAIVAVGTSVGVMPGVLPLSATLALEAILLLVVSMTIVWRLLRAGPALGPARSAVVLRGPVRGRRLEARGRLRPATALFFVGAAAVAEIGWKPGALTLSDTFFAASFGWCCVSVLRQRSVERVPTLLVAGVALFAIGGVASVLGPDAQIRSITGVGRGIWVMLLWPWTATMVIRDRRDLLIVIVLWIAGGSVDALGALGQATGLSSIAGPVGGNRATGFASSPNDLGAASGALLVPALALATKFRAGRPALRALQWGAVLLVAAALVLSGSVSGVAGGLVGLILWTVSPDVRGGTRMMVVFGLAGALVLSSVIGGSVPSPVHRVQEVFAPPGSSPNAGSGSAHLDTIKHSWPRIRSDPLIGVGLDRSYLVHSGFVAAWLGGGIFALVGLVLAFGAVLSLGWWAAVAAPNEADRVLAWSLVCAFVAFLIFFAGQPLFFNQYGFIAATLLVAWGLRVADSRARGDSVGETAAAVT